MVGAGAGNREDTARRQRGRRPFPRTPPKAEWTDSRKANRNNPERGKQKTFSRVVRLTVLTSDSNHGYRRLGRWLQAKINTTVIYKN